MAGGDYGYRARLPGSVVMRYVPQAPSLGTTIVAGAGKLAGAVSDNATADAAAQAERTASDRRIAEIEQRRARAAKAAKGMGDLAELQLTTAKALDDLRNKAPADGTGHEAEAAELVRSKGTEFLDAIGPDEELQNQFGPMVARWTTSAIDSERTWERTARVKAIGTSFQAWQDTQSGSLYTAPTAQSYAQLLADGDAAIDQQDIDATAKAALKAANRKRFGTALLDGLLDKGQDKAVEDLLATGQFDAAIGGAEGRARYGQRIEAAREVQAREAEAAANQARTAALDKLKEIKAKIGVGESVTQGDINAAIQQAQTAGVKAADLIEFAGLGADTVVAQSAQKMGTRELENQRQALQDKRNAGTATPADERALGAIDNEMKQRTDRLTADIAPMLKANRPAAIAEIRKLPIDQRWQVAMNAGDGQAAVLAGLTPQAAAWAQAGRDSRKGREAEFLPPKSETVKDPQAELRRIFDTVIGPDLRRDIGPAYDAMMQTALDVMAGRNQRWDPRQFGRAVRVAFGSTARASDGQWQGGFDRIEGRTVELPDKWTAGEFATRYARYDFGGAVYADGRPAAAADVRRHYRPALVGTTEAGDTIYRLIGPDGRALQHKGSDGMRDYSLIVPERPR